MKFLKFPVLLFCLVVCAALNFGCKKVTDGSAPGDAVAGAPTTPTPTVPTKFTNGQAASLVMGQANFASNVTAVTASGMTVPTGVAISAAGFVYVSEQNNSRVLGFAGQPTTNFEAATTVLGQNVFTSPAAGSTADAVNQAHGVSSAGTQLFVSDFGNHRVLIFNSLTTGASAAVAIGQASTGAPVDPGASVTATTMRFPYGVFVSGTKIAIADGSFNRVSLFNSIPSSSGAAMSFVIGQLDKTSGASGSTRMNSPRAVWTDGTKILVADGGNHRVLIWNSWPTADGVLPNLVLGQTTINGITSNSGGLSASSLAQPEGVFSNGTEVFVTDSANNRVLIWNTWPTTNKQPADLVLGQPDFTTAGTGTTATTLNGPRKLFYQSPNLYVADSGNHRVLIFTKQ